MFMIVMIFWQDDSLRSMQPDNENQMNTILMTNAFAALSHTEHDRISDVPPIECEDQLNSVVNLPSNDCEQQNIFINQVIFIVVKKKMITLIENKKDDLYF